MGTSDSKLLVKFPLLGKETEYVTDWQISSAYLTPVDSFQFTLFDPELTGEYLELQPVELYVNGAQQLLGRIDRTRQGDRGSAITCSGRDFMANLTECNVDPTLKLKLGDQLYNAVLMAAAPVGITTAISEDDIELQTVRSGKKIRKSGGGSTKRRSSKRKGKPVQDFKPQPGESIFEFLNKLICRAGATIQPGTDRNTLVIEEPLYEQEPLYRILRTNDAVNGTRNNILSAVADRNFDKFPTYTLINGTQARGGDKGLNAHFKYDIASLVSAFRSELNAILTTTSVGDRWLPGKCAGGVEKNGLLYRLFVHRDEVARDSEQVENAARRALAERLKDTLEYTCLLRGHSDQDSGAIWSVNTIVQVDDDISRVHEPLWIAERTLSYSRSEGAKTELKCWRPEAFQLTEDSGAPTAGGKAKAGKPKPPTPTPMIEKYTWHSKEPETGKS